MPATPTKPRGLGPEKTVKLMGAAAGLHGDHARWFS